MDDRLVELERRWRESGSREDERALLRARARAGLIEPPRLALAAYLGNEAASDAFAERGDGLVGASDAAWVLGVSTSTLGRWCRGEFPVGAAPRVEPLPHTSKGRARRFELRRVVEWRFAYEHMDARVGERAVRICHRWAGREGSVRAAVALARHVEMRWRDRPEPIEPEVAFGLEALDRWLREPTEAHAREAERIGSLLRAHRGGLEGWSVWASRACSAAMLAPIDRTAPNDAQAAAASALFALQEDGRFTILDDARLRAAEAELERAMASEVVPWALGHGDPARDRPRP